MQKNHFLLLKNIKNTASAQLWWRVNGRFVESNFIGANNEIYV